MSSNASSILPRTWIIGIAILSALIFTTAASPLTVIRIRTIDGMRRVALPNNDPNSTLSSILTSAGVELDEDLKCQTSNDDAELDLSPTSVDTHKTAAELGLRHGSMITILSRPIAAKTDASTTTTASNNSPLREEQNDNRYNPYPDLAKSTSYTAASRRARALSRGVSRGMTYGDISKVRSTMHIVEPQSKGPLTRIYVCQVGAAKFQNHCLVKSNTSSSNKKQSTIASKKKNGEDDKMRVENRVALLFGTINKEAVDKGRKKARTSLSSPRSDEQMCEVAKVHAVWEPPFQKPKRNGKHYDEECLLSNYCTTTTAASESMGKEDEQPPAMGKGESHTDRAIRIASWLGLHPIGWIFSYADEDRHEDGDALPVHGRDAIIGSYLQIETMKRRGREEGCKFVTLALDGRVGATEAFQLSDVCVQMVAEGVLPSPHLIDGANGEENAPSQSKSKSTRFLSLQDPVIVSGEETKQLDSVLLLVNMAMLSHVGMYSGGTNAPMGGNVKRSSGELLVKTRKRILSALKEDSNNNNGGGALKELCDLDILVALDLLIGKKESEKLCKLVRNYARGQKKGTVLDDHLKLTLQTVLGG